LGRFPSEGLDFVPGEEQAAMSKQREPRDTVPIHARFPIGELYDLVCSEPMQKLLAGRVDAVQITWAKTYAGRACRRNGLRLIRLSELHDLKEDELTFIICHELAHHEVGVEQQHSAEWREACAELAREAGKLGLLSKRRVKQAVTLALHHAATSFRGWPKQAQRFEEQRDATRENMREKLIEAGLRVGGMVGFEYRGRPWRGEVLRINKATVSVGAPGDDRTLLRVPFGRITSICED
jgi:hypothetical protein